MKRERKIHFAPKGASLCGAGKYADDVEIRHDVTEATCGNCLRIANRLEKPRIVGGFVERPTDVEVQPKSATSTGPQLQEPWLAPPEEVRTALARDLLIGQVVYARLGTVPCRYRGGYFVEVLCDGWCRVGLTRRYSDRVEIDLIFRGAILQTIVHPEQVVQVGRFEDLQR